MSKKKVKLHKKIRPDPLGRKSRPTMLSKTEDFPELCSISKESKRNSNTSTTKIGGNKPFPKIQHFFLQIPGPK